MYFSRKKSIHIYSVFKASQPKTRMNNGTRLNIYGELQSSRLWLYQRCFFQKQLDFLGFFSSENISLSIEEASSIQFWLVGLFMHTNTNRYIMHTLSSAFSQISWLGTLQGRERQVKEKSVPNLLVPDHSLQKSNSSSSLSRVLGRMKNLYFSVMVFRDLVFWLAIFCPFSHQASD